MVRPAIVLIFFALDFSGCGPRPAAVGPKTSELVGKYRTKDRRAAATTLDLRADGTFTLANWPGTNGTGRWNVKQDDVTKTWNFDLVFTAQNYYVGGYQVLGGPGSYSLGFFVSDPDEGAVVLEKQRQ